MLLDATTADLDSYIMVNLHDVSLEPHYSLYQQQTSPHKLGQIQINNFQT